jgi:urease accessory protein
MSRLNRYAVLASALMLPLMAQAHPGHEIHATLMQGLLHPLSGWDHLFVLLSLGALAAGRGAGVAAICGVLMAAALSGGAMVGLAWPAAPFVEPVILVTVFACALLLALRRYINRASLCALCLVFALVHGVAHGQEAPSGDLLAYFAGFTFSGAVIYAAGVVLTPRLLRRMSPAAARSD